MIILAKKKTISKGSSGTSVQRSEHAAPAKEKNAPPNNTPYIVIIALLLVVIAYLLSGGGSNPAAPTPTSNLPDANTFDQATLYTGDIPDPYLKPEFAGFFPDNISGMRRVKLDVERMDSMNDETERQFKSQVVDKAGVLYLSNSASTDFEVEYLVYKMESPDAANRVLNFYSSQWNTIPLFKENVTFWLWKGYAQQIANVQPSRGGGLLIYWDADLNASFLPIDGMHSNYYIASISDDLYCYHGETVKDEYFIMVDVHAGQPISNIENFADKMFAEAAKQISSQKNQT